ncbi:MAG TPA: chitobiase/beta-hexosaminidase C-terminal domain-containing protein, partial [Opitutaceae bacterium]|nr:chitobiase/beta-hexosaminidase C-terminal domain-containing protein [Opitutaceae bacterium]
ALIWGDTLTDIGITGSGTIDGNGHLSTSTNPDKAVSLKKCDGVVITGITIKNGGHFGLFTNGTNNMMIDNIKILEANQRDGFNLINAKHIFITNSDIEGSDDSMCLKSDFALCQKTSNEDIHVDNCKILSTGNNAIQFGSETLGDFTDCTFSHCTITKAGKAGLGITTNDGSVIDGVTFSDITLTGCVTPIWMKIDHVNRVSGFSTTGKIRNVSFINITGSGNGSTTSTVEGCGTVSPAVTIDNIVFNNVHLTVPGGGSASDANNVPPTDDHWQPRYLGTAPSYGFFLRHVKNIVFLNCGLGFSSNDNRPAIKCDNDGMNIKIDSLTFQKGSGRPYDLGFVNVNGYQVTNSDTPTLLTTGSTAASIAFPPVFSLHSGIYSGSQTVSLTSADSGATIRYTTDDSTPTSTTGTVYTGPITVASDTPFRAIASVSGLRDSAVDTGIYVINGGGPSPAAAPVFSPGGGTYASAQMVSITSASPGVIIRYTTDGSTPTETNGTVYSGALVNVGTTTTLQAIAFGGGFSDSSVSSASYTIGSQQQAAAPVFSPAAGSYATAQSVTITSATGGASIRYTTDGSNPSETAGTLYSGPVSIASSVTLKAIAFESGFTDSTVTSGAYTIGSPQTFNFEAESLSYTGSGATTSVQTDSNSSGGKWVELAGNSTGDHIDFTIPSIPAGTYQLKMEWKGNNSRGILQLSVDGTNLGSTLDQYSSGQTYPTTTFGNVTFSAAGTHDVRLTVTGKNSSSSGEILSADKFTFTGQ